MRYFIFMFFCVRISYCLAQMNPEQLSQTDYWNYFCECNEPKADIVALSVLESQSCPTVAYTDSGVLCDTRYQIIRVLGSTPGALTPQEDYLEVKQEFVHTKYRHRPILIFGRYNDSVLRVAGYEDVRNYFRPSIVEMGFSFSVGTYIYMMDFAPIAALHSVGTPYSDVKNWDGVDMKFNNEFLLPYAKLYVEAVGKNFKKLRQCLSQNRTKINVFPIKNEFAALGGIRSARPVSDSGGAKFCELDIGVELIFKNKANVDTGIKICKDGDCPPLISLRKPIYLFGDLKNGQLVIEKLASVEDMFVWGDEIFDISMGLPLEELYEYFLPPNLSFEAFVLQKRYRDYFVRNVKAEKRAIAVNQRMKKIFKKLHEKTDVLNVSASVQLTESQQKFIADAHQMAENNYYSVHRDTLFQQRKKKLYESDAGSLYFRSLFHPFRCHGISHLSPNIVIEKCK